MARAREGIRHDQPGAVFSLDLGVREERVARRLLDVLVSAQRAGEAELRFLVEPPRLPPVPVPAEARSLPQQGPVLGRCSSCGRDLTDELSAARGFGPRCWQTHVAAHPEADAIRPLSPRQLRHVLQALAH